MELAGRRYKYSVCDHPDCICLPLSYKMPGGYVDRGHITSTVQPAPTAPSLNMLRCSRCNIPTCDSRLYICAMCNGTYCSAKVSSVSLAAHNPVCLRCKYPEVFSDAEEFISNLQ